MLSGLHDREIGGEAFHILAVNRYCCISRLEFADFGVCYEHSTWRLKCLAARRDFGGVCYICYA